MRPRLIGAAAALLGLLLCACGAAQRVAAPTSVPTPTLQAQGRALFLNRGCATCHINSNVGDASQSIGIGPNLTVYRGDESFLREWLRNPAALRPGTPMPTLGLSEAEIDALSAFLLTR